MTNFEFLLLSMNLRIKALNTMLSQSVLFATAPTTDVARTTAFYQDKLGLKVMHSDDDGIAFEAGKGTSIYLYKRAPSKADHTIASFMVDNMEKEVADLKAKGVRFEEYDMPGMKTVNGIATWGKDKAAWFKDPDGNIIGLFQKG